MSGMLVLLAAAQTGMVTTYLRAVPRSVSMPPARVAKIGLAYDIYAEVPVEEAKFAGTENEALEAIFLLHAEGPVLKPGTPMYVACQDLASQYPALSALSDDALVGRLFQYLDADGDGVLEVDEWVPGVAAVLNKSEPRAAALAERFAQGLNGAPQGLGHPQLPPIPAPLLRPLKLLMQFLAQTERQALLGVPAGHLLALQRTAH